MPKELTYLEGIREALAEEMRRAFDCRQDRTKAFTPGHIETIKELLQAAAQRYE